MTIHNQQSPLDSPEIKQFILRLIKAGETNVTVARAVQKAFGIVTSENSIRRFKERHANEVELPDWDKSDFIRDEDIAYLRQDDKSESGAPLPDPDRMLKERGLDPAEWYVDGVTSNEWEGPTKEGTAPVTYRQTKFAARRRTSLFDLQPARSDGWKPPERKKNVRAAAIMPQLAVVCGDQQAPFHDRNLHRLFCEWLADYQPDEGVALGDLGDYPNISRHKRDPENIALTNECIQEGYEILRDYIAASPNTHWRYLLGNHENRIRDYILNNAPELYGLSQARTDVDPGTVVHSISHLLRLDELGVDLIDPQGSYESAYITLSDNLAVYHGWKAAKGSGVTALRTLEQAGFSVIMGHSHRQSEVFHTYHEIPGSGKVRQLSAVEVGCMCKLHGKPDELGRRFPNYATLPDWQNGFASAEIYPDGKFNIDLAKYVNQVLLYRSDRYQ